MVMRGYACVDGCGWRGARASEWRRASDAAGGSRRGAQLQQMKMQQEEMQQAQAAMAAQQAEILALLKLHLKQPLNC